MVYLIGAGPGDGGLITVKGLQLLRTCDAVIYDHLGTGEIIDEIPEKAARFYVGKRAGAHSYKQEEINQLLLETAGKYDRVVRLKGGDSFVFGRGGEEIEALETNRIAYEVIPGISSSISVPELCGIPVTHRGMARSFSVFTGHSQQQKGSGESEFPAKDIRMFAGMSGTGVFLMGYQHLEQIVETLLEGGKPIHTPVVLISKGSIPGQQVIRGTLEDIVAKARKAQPETPVIIVVGDTAALQMVSEDRGPLCGKNIGIIGTDLLRAKLSTAIEREGGKAYSLARMKVVPGEDLERFQVAIQNIENYHWIVFTGQNGIEEFFRILKKARIDVRRLANCRFAVIGAATEKALEEYGVMADCKPKEYTAKALAELLCEITSVDDCILLPRAQQGSKDLLRIVKESGRDISDYHIYDVKGELTECISYLKDLQLLVFCSSSGVRDFFGAQEELLSRVHELKIPIACIGEVTQKELQKYGLQAAVVPKTYDVEGLMESIKEAVRNSIF